jgi:hypothetical protein
MMVRWLTDVKPWGHAIFVFSAVCWELMASRALAAPLLLVAIVFSPVLMRSKKRGVLVSLWGLFVLATVAPVDVSFRNYPGGPHLVPVIMGLPGRELFDRAKQREVVLGGCAVTGFEPKWVLVW